MASDLDVYIKRLEGVDLRDDLMVTEKGTFLCCERLQFSEGVVRAVTRNGLIAEVTGYHPAVHMLHKIGSSANDESVLVVMLTEKLFVHLETTAEDL